MTILSGSTIRARCIGQQFGVPLRLVEPFAERSVFRGMTYGLGYCGYDVRIAEDIRLVAAHRYGDPLLDHDEPHQVAFALASTIERFSMPNDVMGRVTDKSTWARCGLAVQNTVIEPGWRGHLTLELTNHSDKPIAICAGMPIAQIIFELLDFPAEGVGYNGRYQDQPAGPQPPKYTSEEDAKVGKF